MESQYTSEADLRSRASTPNFQRNEYGKAESRWDAVYTFCNYTNAHGYYWVAYGEKRITRIFWTIVLSCSILASLIHIGILLKRHLEFDVNAKIDLNTGRQFLFPDITICPNSRYFMVSGVPENTVNQSFYLMKNAKVPSLGENTTFEKIWTNANKIWLTMLGNVDATQSDGERRLARFSTNPYIFEAQIVRHKMNMAIICSYKEKVCSHVNYTAFYHPDVHVCITFRPENREVSTLNVAGGLIMDLLVPYVGETDVEEAKTMTGEESDFRLNGATVVAHPPNSLPNLEGLNVVVPRNGRFSVGLEMTETLYMDVNGRCANSPKPILLLQNGKIREFEYSQYACSQVQFQEAVAEKCGCLSELFYIPAKYISGQIPFCHTIDKDLLNYDNLNVSESGDWIVASYGQVKVIKASVLETYRSRQECHRSQINHLKETSHVLLKNCKISCTKTVYDIQVNSATINKFESDEKRSIVEKRITKEIELMKELGYYTQVMDKLVADIPTGYLLSQHYLAGFAAYPIKKSRQVIVEELVYPLVNFFCDMGGVLGFWMGFSIITLMEVIELAMSITCCWKVK